MVLIKPTVVPFKHTNVLAWLFINYWLSYYTRGHPRQRYADLCIPLKSLLFKKVRGRGEGD